MPFVFTDCKFTGGEGSRGVTVGSGEKIRFEFSRTIFNCDTGIEVRDPVRLDFSDLKKLITTVLVTRAELAQLEDEVRGIVTIENRKAALKGSKLIQRLSITADTTSLVSFVSTAGSPTFIGILNRLFGT